MAESSPVVARWELSRRLAARRKELGVDVKTITNALGFTRNYWSAVENDRTLIAEDKLRLVFDVLRLDDQERNELLALREDSRRRGWWDEHPGLDSLFKRFYGMEAGAYRIRAYDGLLIPGILQIEPYTRAIVEADPVNSRVDVDLHAAVRRERQKQVFEATRPEYIVLVSEAALRQQLTDPALHRTQLEHILTIISSRSLDLDLRVVTFKTNPGAIIGSSTLLFLEFPSSHLPQVAWQEAVRFFTEINEDDEQFRQLDFAWSTAMDRALSREDSTQLIRKIAASL